MISLRLIYYTLVGTALFTLLCSGSVEAQLPAKPVADSLSQVLSEQEFADNKESTFLAFIVQEQQAYRDFLERLITIVASIVMVVLIVVGYFTYRSYHQLQQQVRAKLYAYTSEIVDEELRSLRTNTILPIKREIRFLQAFQDSHILFVGQPAYGEQLLAMVLRILRRSGLSQLHNVAWPSAAQVAEASLIVYLYPPSGAPEKLAELLELLAVEKKPLLLYTDGWQDMGAEKESLRRYGWFILANMPLTLLEHLVATARLFHHHQSPSAIERS